LRSFYFSTIFFSGLLLIYSELGFVKSSPQSSVPSKPLLINGAGASFPYILYSKWFSEYRKIKPSIMINYRSIGSGGGIRQFLSGTLDFGATDVPIQKTQLKKTQKTVLQLPTTLGAVVISYHVKSLKGQSIRLTADLLADIYADRIKKWNHKKITAINPHLPLPNQNIVPVFRADGSGTTAVFTEYLSQFSKNWLKEVGKGKAVAWPSGIGGKGNEGVTGLLQKIPGAIGYIGLSYALNRNLPTALIRNGSGHFVKATLNSVTQAAEWSWKKHKDWFKPLSQAQGEKAYPMASYTYLLIYKEMSPQKGTALVNFLNWAIESGQTFCKDLHYIPLPKIVAKQIKQNVQTIKILQE